jgi:hypothetical protein
VNRLRTALRSPSFRPFALLPALVLAAFAVGCGINKSRLATEQLVVSEAVDKAVATIDFSPLSGRRVYFDTQYLDGVNMGQIGNVKYVISSLRQQMAAYDLRLQEKPETAEYIVEGRIGVLANDGYEVTYGIPGNAAAASATVLLPTPVPVPAPGMPELSIGRRNHQAGTAKVGLFAYDRVTREPVWQAGVRRGASDVRDTWFLGLGPYHYRPKRNKSYWSAKGEEEQAELAAAAPLKAYSSNIVFQRALAPPPASPRPAPPPHSPAVVPASGQQPVPQSPGMQPVLPLMPPHGAAMPLPLSPRPTP